MALANDVRLAQVEAARAESFKWTAARLAMIAAPSLFILGELLGSRNPLSEQNVNPENWFVGHMLLVVAGLAFVPAAMTMMRLSEQAEKATWLALAGVTLVVIGVVASTGILTMDFVAGELAAAGNREQMLALYRSVSQNAAIAGFETMQAALPLGMFMLAVGLYLARSAPRWVAALIAIGVLFANPSFPDPIAIGARLALFAALSYLAWQLRRRPPLALRGRVQTEVARSRPG